MRSYASVDSMFLGMLKDVRDTGTWSSPRGQKQKEVHGWTGVLMHPRRRFLANSVRKIRQGYPAASLAWNLGLRLDVESICWWNSEGRRVSDDGVTFYGANYGARILNDLVNRLDLLREDPDTRRAWVPLLGTRDVDRDPKYLLEGKDVPCTIGMSLWLENGLINAGKQLSAEVIMRSQSAYGVFPYDAYLFSALLELCANELDVALGELYWHCVSLHYYERELEKVMLVLESDDYVSHEDAPIKYTLTEAMQVYPLCFQSLTPTIQRGYPFEADIDDPVIARMHQGYLDITAVELQEANKA